MSDHPDLLEPPPGLGSFERLGWRSFFAGRSMRSMNGYEQTSGWWKAYSHVYALGWSSTLNSASTPEGIRAIGGLPLAAWIDGRQRHQALMAQAAMVLRAVR